MLFDIMYLFMGFDQISVPYLFEFCVAQYSNGGYYGSSYSTYHTISQISPYISPIFYYVSL